MMRILIANDGCGDAGGVQVYLDAVMDGLTSRGHEIAILYRDGQPALTSTRTAHALAEFSVAERGADAALGAVRQWQPEICFSHNMSDLDLERRLLDVAPVVKFMHGYFGTCVGGQKRFGLPVAQPCGRTFGAPCAALYLPRRCGQLSLAKLVRQYRWAKEQQDLFSRYRAVVVASDHMKREYARNGATAEKIHVAPLFPTHDVRLDEIPAPPPSPSVVFFGRMTTLKGGDLLIRAVAEASRRLHTTIDLTMVGDGPQRPVWEQLASRLTTACTFVGWQKGPERWKWLRRASLLAVPSSWPEPFGLVGLEAAAFGVPAIAFDVGGIREWLRPGENGYLVAADPPRASALADGLVRAFGRPDELHAMRSRAVAVARQMSLARHLDRLETILAAHANRHAHPAYR